MQMLEDKVLVELGPSEYDGSIRRECYSGAVVTGRPSWAATSRLCAALSKHPTLIKRCLYRPFDPV